MRVEDKGSGPCVVGAWTRVEDKGLGSCVVGQRMWCLGQTGWDIGCLPGEGSSHALMRMHTHTHRERERERERESHAVAATHLLTQHAAEPANAEVRQLLSARYVGVTLQVRPLRRWIWVGTQAGGRINERNNA